MSIYLTSSLFWRIEVASRFLQLQIILQKQNKTKPQTTLHNSFELCVVLSRVPLFVTSWTVVHQAPLSMEFSRQEYWSGLLCPSLGDLPDPGIEPLSPPLAARFFTTLATWEDLWISLHMC